MKIKNLIALLIIIATVVVAVILFNSYHPGVKTTQEGSIILQDKQITDDTKPLKISITYPQINGLDDFNQKVEQIINDALNAFKENSLANDQAVKEIDPQSYAQFPREYELNIAYAKGQVDGKIISIIFTKYSFEGGAHGATTFIPLNYNTETKQEIKLPDLFIDQPNYLQKISEFCIADLKRQMSASGAIDMTDNGWINEGAGPAEENYSIFLINKDNIVFYFPQYQVAAYAAGDFQVTYQR
jgi:hypothetical protein